MKQAHKSHLVIALICFLLGCSQKDPPSWYTLSGRVSTNQDVLALFRVSDQDFESAREAYASARERPDATAQGFMSKYWRLAAIENHAVACKNQTFRTRIGPGKNVLAIADGDHGSFMPLLVVGDVSIDYDKESAWMTR